jgi:anti-sigma factor RsiW
MHGVWMDRLSEYVDEGLERPEREALEAHLKDCASCEAALADLKDIRARARNLSNAPAPPEVWSGIEAGIARGRNLAFPADRKEPRRAPGSRFSFSFPELIAAGLAIAIVSGGTVFAVLHHRESRTPAPATTVARGLPAAAPSIAPEPVPETPLVTAAPAERTGGDAVNAARTPESPHEEAISELRKVLAKERDKLDPATIRTLEANLAIIDLAIDQARRALAADPANTYVKEHLAETMRRKVELLHRATMLASASTSEGSR